MSIKFKDIDKKIGHTAHFNDMINIKNLDPKKIKVNEKRYENILIHYIEYVTVKNLSYVRK